MSENTKIIHNTLPENIDYNAWLHDHRHMGSHEIISLAMESFLTTIPETFKSGNYFGIAKLFCYLSELDGISKEVSSELTDLMLYCEGESTETEHEFSRAGFVQRISQLLLV